MAFFGVNPSTLNSPPSSPRRGRPDVTPPPTTHEDDVVVDYRTLLNDSTLIPPRSKNNKKQSHNRVRTVENQRINDALGLIKTRQFKSTPKRARSGSTSRKKLSRRSNGPTDDDEVPVSVTAMKIQALLPDAVTSVEKVPKRLDPTLSAVYPLEKIPRLRKRHAWHHRLRSASCPTFFNSADVDVNFVQFLTVPGAVESFRDFLASEFSEENIIFWLAVERYRHTEEPDLRQRLAGTLMQTYVVDGASCQINLSGDCRREVEHHVWRSEFHKGLFDRPQRDVEHLMEMDSFRRYLLSQHYVTFREAYQRGDFDTIIAHSMADYDEEDQTDDTLSSADVIEFLEYDE